VVVVGGVVMCSQMAGKVKPQRRPYFAVDCSGLDWMGSAHTD
jgi:hypothetical protein